MRYLSSFLSVVACLLLLATRPVSAHRQSDGGENVQVAAEDATTFNKAMESLARQSRNVLVVEGTPLQETLPSEKLSSLKLSGAFGMVIGSIATAYDYEIAKNPKRERTIPNLYILRKRYSDPRDLPPVTFEECEIAFEKIQRMLKTFGPQPPIRNPEEFVSNLSKTFTPEQMQALALQGLPVANLLPQQRDQVQRMVLHIFVGLTISDFENNAIEFGEIQKAVIKKGKAQISPGRFEPGEVIGFEKTYPHGKYFVKAEGYGFGLMNVKPLTIPAPDLNALSRRMQTTLEDVIARLQKRDPNTPLSLDKSLVDKPILVFGEKFASNSDILDAIAELYGLRVLQDSETKGLRIAPGSVRTPQHLSELYPAIRKSLPLPFLRASHDGILDRLSDELTRSDEEAKRANEQVSAELRAGKITEAEAAQRMEKYNSVGRFNYFTDQQNQYRRFADYIGWEAVRRLVFGVEQVHQKSGKPVPFAELDASTRAAFGITLTAKFLQRLNEIPQKELPLYIRDFEKAVITMRPTTDPGNGKKLLSFLLKVPNTNGVGVEVGFAVADKRNGGK